MVSPLVRKILYFLPRNGRYFARRTVPPELQPYIGTTELREPLGPDRKVALEKLHLALVTINARLDHARRALVSRGLKGSSIQQADDARRLTAEEVIAWRDEKLESLSSKTVKDVWLASLKSVLSDAVSDRLLETNVAKGIRVRMYAAPVLREKGFTDVEARAILKLCRQYEPTERDNPANRESEHVTRAKRWGPWLCAFTGARVTEILQLRKSDVRTVDGIPYLHITPEAGSVKSKKYRDVPLHQQLIDIGFLEFVEEALDGPLFHSAGADPKKLPAQAVSARVGKWLQSEKLIPDGVQPNHGWRHRFKTLSREAGLDPHVVDSIQGHTGRTASDGYGDVTLRAKKAAIDKLSSYDLDA